MLEQKLARSFSIPPRFDLRANLALDSQKWNTSGTWWNYVAFTVGSCSKKGAGKSSPRDETMEPEIGTRR